MTHGQVGEERDWWLCIFQPNYVYGHARLCGRRDNTPLMCIWGHDNTLALSHLQSTIISTEDILLPGSLTRSRRETVSHHTDWPGLSAKSCNWSSTISKYINCPFILTRSSSWELCTLRYPLRLLQYRNRDFMSLALSGYIAPVQQLQTRPNWTIGMYLK